MQYTILLSRFEDTKAVEAQEQSRFIKSILEALELPIEFNPDQELSIDEHQKFKQSLRDFNLNVIDDMDGGIKIYVGNNKNDLVAEWYKPTYKLKKDLSQLNKRDQLYLEMNNVFWSVFEEEEMNK